MIYIISRPKNIPRDILSSRVALSSTLEGFLAKVSPQPWRLFFPPGSSAVTRPFLPSRHDSPPAPDNSPGILGLPVDCKPGATFGGHNAFTTHSRGEGEPPHPRGRRVSRLRARNRDPPDKGERSGPSRCSLLPVLFRYRYNRHARDTNCRSVHHRTTSRHFAQKFRYRASSLRRFNRKETRKL